MANKKNYSISPCTGKLGVLLPGEEVIDHSGLDYYDPERGTPVSAEPPRPRKRTNVKTTARSK